MKRHGKPSYASFSIVYTGPGRMIHVSGAIIRRFREQSWWPRKK